MKRITFNDNWRWAKENSGMWEQITLPHDAMLREERSENSPGGSAVGFFNGGKYIYEKEWEVPAAWQGDYLAVEFEGVYQKSEVYVNGMKAGACVYGYIPFVIDISKAVKYGENNVIQVRVNNEDMPNSRWYTGAGIYRPVHLIHGNAKHITHRGIKISTLSYEPARIKVEAEVFAGADAKVQIAVCKDGTAVTDTELMLPRNEEAMPRLHTVCAEMAIEDAKLWSEDTPELYTCQVQLLENETVLDEVEETFGIRKVTWNENGLFVNGKETLLRGGCVHHDNGILGACTYEKSEERRVRLMKEMGYNAIRSAHNPASEGMLRACDKYGMYLLDETWDMWYGHKNKHDYATEFMEHYKDDVKAMVDRDFNHPSVIMYSIANEISEPREEKGVALAKELVEYIHELDSNRAVTAGINLMVIHMASQGKGVYKEDGGRADQDKAAAKKPKKQKASGSLFFNMLTSMIGTNMNKMANSDAADKVTSPCLDALDIAGYNYASGRYPLEGKKHPGRIVVGSETFPMDIAKNWEMVKKYPYMIGDFMWTSWDYLGEAGIGAWTYDADGANFDKPYPWILADVGAFDILGNPGAEAYYAKTVWGISEKPYIGVRPVNHPGIRVRTATWRGSNAFDSWSWKNCEGNKAEVEVYADAAKVELLLNGKSLGRKKIKAYKAMFKTKYVPGTLTAAAYDEAGNEVGRTELCSAEGAVKLAVRPEEKMIKAGDIVYVPIQLEGQNAIVESNADTGIHVTVEGGSLLGFGSAVPKTLENYYDGHFNSYYGRTLAVVKAEHAGTIKVKAAADNGLHAEAEVFVVE